MNEVRIIYCNDENMNTIFYNDTVKGCKYFCIDCGDELIVKDGVKNIKHLSHKNNSKCNSTGESIFHKHWKENLFRKGMYITVTNERNEFQDIMILDVLYEVDLNKRYNMKLIPNTISDLILITEYGDVAIEINYKNPKNWIERYDNYSEYPLFRIYEVEVSHSLTRSYRFRNADLLYTQAIEAEEQAKERKKEIEIEKDEKQKRKKIKDEVRQFVYYVNTSKYPKYDKDKNTTSVSGVLYDPVTNEFKNKIIKLEGYVTKDIGISWIDDKEILKLKTLIFNEAIRCDEDGNLQDYDMTYEQRTRFSTYIYKEKLKSLGCKWNGQHWNIKNSQLEKYLQIPIITFTHDGNIKTISDYKNTSKTYNYQLCKFPKINLDWAI